MVALVATACSGGGRPTLGQVSPDRNAFGSTVPGARPNGDVYAATAAGNMSPATSGALDRIYVPDSEADAVDVIDPSSGKVIDHFRVGHIPQHVTPSWDLKQLYVNNTEGDSLTPIDPSTGKRGAPIPVADPYNLYFTPDGLKAVVVAERLRRLDFRDPHTWKLIKSLPIAHPGVDHLDFSADGRYLLVSCEFSGFVVKVDVVTMEVVGELQVGGAPIDVRLSPDGTVFFVADQNRPGHRDGVHVVDGETMRELEFIPTGKGAHGLYFSRDARHLYATNRLGGSVSVIDVTTRKVVATWAVPNGSPDMGGVSPDGGLFWVAGRFHSEVYAIDTRTGKVAKRIAVGKGPHGLCLFPQPGRFSLGHTGNYR